jgi:hypothetical protein
MMFQEESGRLGDPVWITGDPEVTVVNGQNYTNYHPKAVLLVKLIP